MNPYDHPALVLGGTDRRSEPQRLADRIRLVLETQPGHLPFNPSFGCDLSGLVGSTANKSNLSIARSRITGALGRWIPDIQVQEVEVTLVEPRRYLGRPAEVPLAEAALASQSISQVLQVRLEILTTEGMLHFNAALSPGMESM